MNNLKEIQLIEPSSLELDESYRRLPNSGNISIKIQVKDLEKCLVAIENIGYTAIEIFNLGTDNQMLKLTGYKGKHGPCFNTDRKSKYTGSALATLDDDYHILFHNRQSSVCEKTANVYGFLPYKNLIKTTEASSVLLEKLKTDPEIFNINRFEEDQLELFYLLKDINPDKDRTYAFYPGPFKILILSDGTMVRRGRINNISKNDYKLLSKTDRLYRCTYDKKIEPVFYQDEYNKFGSRCLLNNQGMIEKSDPNPETDLNALIQIEAKIDARLKHMILGQKNYFILTGSDPMDKQGCCPSDEVGEANRLVHAGILSKIKQSVQMDACPVSIYTFKGEIKIVDNEIEFKPNKTFRDTILHILERKKSLGYKRIVKWMLLGFVILSIFLAIVKLKNSFEIDEHRSLYDRLSPGHSNIVMVLLFHYQTRCAQCINMENHINNLLEGDYEELVSKGQVQFALININMTENQDLVRRFELYTASIVMVKFEQGEERKIVILRDIWKLHEKEDMFMGKLRQELNKLILEEQ